MKVNNFPSLTWNFLNINSTTLDVDFDSFPVLDNETLAGKLGFDYRSIETGLGREFDGFLDELHEKKGGAPAYFEVEKGSRDTVHKIDFSPDSDNVLSDVVVNALEGSDSTFILVYEGNAGTLGSRVRLNLEENAHVHLVTVNMLGGKGIHFNSIGSRCADNAHVEITELELGGSNVYTGTYNDLAGYRSRFTGRLSYVVRKDGQLDINQVAHQTGRRTESHFTVDGVLMDNARKTWRGTIDFKRGCVDAVGDEQEDVLLLNPDVVNKSLPVILCDEEAVEGRHGCSIGKLDMEKLFYMQSRGIDEETARSLLTKAKVYKVSRFIDDEELCSRINDFIEN